MKLNLITSPATEPITLLEAQAYLRGPSSDDDTLITSLIKSARAYVENYLHRSLINQTWDLILDACDLDYVYNGFYSFTSVDIPRPPLVSISYVKYYTSTNTLNTYSTDYYTYYPSQSISKIQLNIDQVFPTDLRTYDSIVIRFVSGYGSSASSVPDDIKQALLLIIGALYENRGDEQFNIPTPAKLLLNPYKIILV